MYSGCALNCLFILIIIQSVKCFIRSRNIANTSGIKLSYRYLLDISMSDRNPGDLSVSIGPNALGLERIEVYSTLGCKYCRMAKFKLEELGLEYHNVDITEPAETTVDQMRQEARVAHARARTVPQIYVGAELVGGCDSMLDEIAKGTFFERLDRHQIIASVSESTATTPIMHSKTPSSVRLMESVDLSPESVTREGVLNSLKNDLGPEILLEPSSKEKINPLELSSALQKQALLLTDKFAAMDGSRIDYKKMRASKEFEEYIVLSESLQLCTLSDLSSLPSPARLSFFVNLYNALIIHANCVLGTPSTPQGRARLFNGESGAIYRIGGQKFSPDDIEHAVLRGNSPHPSQPPTTTTFLPVWDPRSRLALPYLDPRIHFVLNCGAQSCPPIKILGEDPELALSTAAAAYVEGDVVKMIEEESGLEKVFIPRLSLWYTADFGRDMKSKISKLLLMSPIGGRSYTVLTELLEKYKECGEKLTGPEAEVAERELDDTVRYNAYSWVSNDIN